MTCPRFQEDYRTLQELGVPKNGADYKYENISYYEQYFILENVSKEKQGSKKWI